ncbi:F0F1 ATP synthase subunit C [uncultured Rubinisphaera sp.]|uniref:F0F1 ATP synthase subunit C n=1 Tax=uncultured Rubinisphaera sp. TaxID=1678686 RepID=UPI0030D96853
MNNSKQTLHLVFAAVVVLSLFAGSIPTALAQDDASQTTAETSGGESKQSDTQSKSKSADVYKLDNVGLVAMCSILVAGLTIAIGSIGPAFGEGRAVAQALTSIAQQPDSSNTITRTLFVGLAMIESTAIYCFVVSMILLFANPFWDYFAQ